MRVLRITLRTPKPIILPLAYNELVQGLLYSCWRDCMPQLHDAGFGEQGLRLFTFGPLSGKASIDGKRRTIRFEKFVDLEVRTPVEDLLDELAGQLATRGIARIGVHELQVVNLESRDRLLFPRQAKVSMLSAVVAERGLDDGHALPLAPSDEGWLDSVRTNATHKAMTLGLTCNQELQVIPLSETLRKRVTRFKGTYVTGWVGDLIVACDPQLLATLYCCGLGAKNSQGFGMFRIHDDPLA
ncbi:MAG: CRISPR-associated endoribonuclease Cas6 [Atopobiaceae bacterium]|nr:CRISPR-associated endoribonuclease Cas6 [Atopobiaceae bacterium]